MEGKLKLNDLLRLTDEELSRTKVRLNMYNGWNNPIDIFKKNPDALLGWNYHNNKSYKKGQISIGLVDMGNDNYLLFTVGLILSVLDVPKNSGVGVEFKTIEKYRDLYGRVIVSYHNTSQNLFRNANTIMDDLIVKEIIPSVFTGFDFPGYQNVCLKFSELETIVKGYYPGYKNALERQKAVYVQTDLSTGKLYIGSATSDNGMLLARRKSYVENGHGGNEGLKELVREKGFDYIKDNFTYTILENFNEGTPDDYVLDRESYWKRVFDTRNHGYNKN